MSDVYFSVETHWGFIGPQGFCSGDGFCKAGRGVWKLGWMILRKYLSAQELLQSVSLWIGFRLVMWYMINSRFSFVCFCRVVILQEVVGWFLETHDPVHSTVAGGLKRHHLYLQTSSTLSSGNHCARQSSGTAQMESRWDISQKAPTATERYGSRLNWLETNALIKSESSTFLFLSGYY